MIVLANFGYEPAGRVGEWFIAEAVRSTREHIVPGQHEARTWFARGDWGNAAWAYEILAELASGRSDCRERAERAFSRCDGR